LILLDRTKDDNGNDLYCSGSRSCFVAKTVKNSRGKDVPIYTAQCAYHVSSCLGEHEEDYPPKVLVPNADGLCIECYFHKHKHSPPKITPDEAPGVYDPKKKSLEQIAQENADRKSEVQSQMESATTMTDKGLLEAKDPIFGDLLDADTICCWLPSVHDMETRGYICQNRVFYNPETKRCVPTCAMHLKFCIKPHTDGSAPIEIPNIHGLCNIHHIAAFGSVPIPVPFPYPGVEKRLKSKGWLVKPGHWGAPTWPPLKPIICGKKYRPPAKPRTYIEKMQELARVIRYQKRKKEYGRLAATAIQAIYRGYRVRYSHKSLLIKNQIPYRAEKVLQIQCQMRRFLHLKIVKRRRILFNHSATQIQKVYHGFLVRRWFRRNRAARVLQRAARMWKDRHFFNTVMMMIQLKKLFQRRIDASIEIQRMIRGYLSRLHFFRYRQRLLLKFSTAAMIVQMVFKRHHKYLEEQRRLALLRNQNKFMKRLASLLENLFYQRKDRHRIREMVMCAVPVMQSLIRGFLGRSRGQRLKFLRNALKSWCQPRYAMEFLKEMLEKRASLVSQSIYVSDNLFQLKTASQTRSHRKVIQLLDFLPEVDQHKSSVDQRSYLQTLNRYYEYLRKPLLLSEVQSLYRRFRDQLDGKIRITELSRYASTHKQPCHKHGRTICGDCVYHRNCTMANCFCRCFVKDDLTGKVCKECHHAIALHTICPLDTKPNRKKANKTLLKILTFVSEPDLSLPTAIKGLELTDIGKQCYREKVRLRKLQRTLEKEEQAMEGGQGHGQGGVGVETLSREGTASLFDPKKDFIQSISELKLSGEDISATKEYWDERSATLPLNVPDGRISITVSTFEPNTTLTASEFWSNASKNPNKTVRDYHEKFDHSMPLPIVTNLLQGKARAAAGAGAKDGDGEETIVYTLDGSRLYVELLKKLTMLYEGDHRTGIHSDNGDFLKLIMNHIQIFERHWRKMVIDIRSGQLNKHLKVNRYVRELYLSTVVPRPAMALQLDQAFRELGFHMKVLGKDIVIQKYAEKKIPKERVERKSSFPLNALGSSGFGPSPSSPLREQITASRTTGSPGGRSSSPLKPILKHAMTAQIALHDSMATADSSLTLPKDLKVKFDSPTQSRTLLDPLASPPTHTSPTKSSSNSSSNKKKKQTRSEALVLASTMGKLAVKELTQREDEKKSRGASANRNNFVRRGSDTDVIRPVTNEEVHRIAHEVQIEPRGKYYHLISVDGERFICPFPACGATFTSREAAFQHLSTHEQRRKLQIPTPLSDSHLNYYWPKDNLWKDSKDYKKRSLPPGSILCSVSGCQEVFASYHRLEYHLKRIHKIEPKSQLLRSFYKFLGRHSRATPPYPPPDYSPAIFCSTHLKLNEACPRCISILENPEIPKQPLYFYDRVKVDFNKRDAQGEVVIFDRTASAGRGVIYLDPQGRQHRGRVQGIVKDSTEEGWVACEELLTIEEAQARHQHVPFDSDHHHELVSAWVRDTQGLGALAGEIAPPTWVRLLDVVTVFPLLEIPKSEFVERLRAHEFLTHTHFLRPGPTG
jgi:hypothetical protein